MGMLRYDKGVCDTEQIKSISCNGYIWQLGCSYKQYTEWGDTMILQQIFFIWQLMVKFLMFGVMIEYSMIDW